MGPIQSALAIVTTGAASIWKRLLETWDADANVRLDRAIDYYPGYLVGTPLTQKALAQSAYNRRYRERLIREGRCVNCRAELTSGRQRCKSCLEKLVVLMCARRERLEAAGLCYVCGKTTPDAGKRRCAACVERCSASNMASAKKKHLEQGACKSCGALPPLATRTLCERCRGLVRAGAKRQRAKRLAANLCVDCGGAKERAWVVKCDACGASRDKKKRQQTNAAKGSHA